MGGAGFLLAINLSLTAVFAAAFWAMANYHRASRPARWFALAFTCAALNFVFEHLIAISIGGYISSIGAAIAFQLALLCGAVGLSEHYRVKLSSGVLAGVAACSFICFAIAIVLPRDDFARHAFYQAPYVVGQGLTVWIVVRGGLHQSIDRILAVLLALSTLHFLAKPFLAMALGGPGATPAEYVGTIYALYSQAMGSILSLAGGVCCLLIFANGIVSDLLRRSEMDSDTGLFNRRGFELRAHGAFSVSGQSMALIILALDEDTGAFPEGLLFAAVGSLVSAVGTDAVAGRIGTREIAILLPGQTLFAARRQADGLRESLARMASGEDAITASIGIAEREVGDSLSDIMIRAENALYEARRAGGNCIRFAPRSHMGTGQGSAS